MAHDVTLITGDGTGPELAEAARMCVDATGVKINWDLQEAGIDVMERTGTPLPEAVLESIHRTHCALKAPITTPVGNGFRSINVHLAAGVRAVRLHPPLQELSGRPHLLSATCRSTWSSSARTPKTSTPASSSRPARTRPPS